MRLVAPGYIGVRNCKWVRKLEISDKECDSHVQKRDYKLIAEPDWSKIDLENYPVINGTVANSCIAYPSDGDVVSGDKVTLKGFAYGDGEKGIPVEKV